jgi:hypothetical protein
MPTHMIVMEIIRHFAEIMASWDGYGSRGNDS